MSLKQDHVISEKSPNPMRETGEENWTRESINENPPELDEKMWEKSRKMILSIKKSSNLN